MATDWGGTPVEAWSSPDALSRCNITSKTPKLRCVVSISFLVWSTSTACLHLVDLEIDDYKMMFIKNKCLLSFFATQCCTPSGRSWLHRLGDWLFVLVVVVNGHNLEYSIMISLGKFIKLFRSTQSLVKFVLYNSSVELSVMLFAKCFFCLFNYWDISKWVSKCFIINVWQPLRLNYIFIKYSKTTKRIVIMIT